MSLKITPEEAGRALREVESSRAAFRRAIRAHRGHFHLWLWGGIWIAMSLLVHFQGRTGLRLLPWLVIPGFLGSTAIGFLQNRQIKVPIDRRFLAALVCLVVFGLLWPLLCGGFTGPLGDERSFAYFALLVMQIYVLAGIWFDNYLLAIGLGVSALILIGLLVFPSIFWIWFAVFCGGPVVLSGFFVRYLWR